jgi:hypothetical protein
MYDKDFKPNSCKLLFHDSLDENFIESNGSSWSHVVLRAGKSDLSFKFNLF